MAWWSQKKAKDPSAPQPAPASAPQPSTKPPAKAPAAVKPAPAESGGSTPWWAQDSSSPQPAAPAPSPAPDPAAQQPAAKRNLFKRLVGGKRRAKEAAKPTAQPAAPRKTDPLVDALVHITSTGQEIAIAKQDEDDLLRELLSAAMRTRASDVHIEPYDDEGGRIRLRVDGRMFPIRTKIDAKQFHQLASRIKVMSELDITNIRTPQDGRFLVRAIDKRIEFRVSVTPCLGGEKLVLRVVVPNAQFLDLDNLILWRPIAEFAKQMFQSPSGLILVTGPTGAGKTTTLYAALSAIEGWDHTLNIVTIEDPVEHNLKFATQIQVNRELDLDFTNILRTILRQDPDVILVGEIRDSESAAMALEAAMTGHLVFSSLHTYSALETLVRLHDLEVKPYLLASALKGVISQQLLPRLHPKSVEPVPATAPVVTRLKNVGVLEPDWSGVVYRGKEIQGAPPGGELGRVGAYEIMLITDRLRDLIDQSAPRVAMEKALDPKFFFSFARYCRFLLKQGLAAPEQVEQMFPKKPLLLPE